MRMKNEVWANESPVDIALGEGIVFTYDFSSVGTVLAVVDEALYDGDGADQASSLLSGSPSVASDVVTASKFTPDEAGRFRYRVSVTIGGSTVFGLCDFVCFDPSEGV